ncbi:PPC domain-containing DNA-binding protein [Oceanobacillus sp. AG]|uniref:PPC domain-containing DNA-binding protein n=1 Tax=Oceanobacillus sp. AG TaxID=2681969 RepID=UPI001E58C717|nr:PPC domain-containing DNA-binding protein [Oceanobacillus sp. AG]
MVNTYPEGQIQSVKGENASCIMGRLTKDVDLLDGLKQVCKQHGIEAASFQCLGSISRIGFVQIESKEDGGLQYSPPIFVNRPAELLSGTGFIGLDAKGELDIHYHGIYVDDTGNISGGHFLEGENPTAVTIEYVIQPIKNVQLKRGPDAYWKLPVFQFTEGG